MLGVPTPPSTTDFTRVVYSFDDGACNNEITFIVAKPNGEYQVSYKSSWQNDNALLTNKEFDRIFPTLVKDIKMCGVNRDITLTDSAQIEIPDWLKK